MANFSKLLSLISGRSATIDFSLVGNVLELGGSGLQMDGSTSGHVVISASAVTSTYSMVWPSAQAASSGYVLSNDGTGVLSWVPSAGGSVTAISVVSANGLAGTSSGGATPALTLSTTVTGILKGNGTAISAATPGTDYVIPSGSITGTAANITDTSNATLTTLSALTTAGSLAISGSQVSGGTFGAVNGSALTNLSAANLSGVLPVGVTGGSGLSIATSQLTGSVGLTSQVSGILPIANGGTNSSSAAGAFANLSPMTTAGDIIYEDATPIPARLPIGSTGQVLTVVSGLPAWSTATVGANQSLSNLTSPTAVNQSLIPSGSSDLGTSANNWSTLYITTIKPGGSPTPSIYMPNGFLKDASGFTSIEWHSRALTDSTGITQQLSWSTAGVEFNQLTPSTVPYLDSGSVLQSSAVTPTELSYLSGVTSAIQTQLNGKLSLTGGTMSGAIAMGSNKITGLADGTVSGDALNWGQIGVANGIAGLDAGGKVPFSQLPSALMVYLGAWDASTNTPTLADGTGVTGDVYRVSVAGTQNLGSGSQTFFVGDFVIYNGTIWQRSPAADGVISVNGLSGAVTVNAINQLTGDVTTAAASGSQSEAATVAKIQGTTVSGTTGSGNVVFSAAPTLTGLLSGGSASFSSTIAASNFSGSSSGTNTGDQTITLTGPVTGSGTGSFATTITAGAVGTTELASASVTAAKLGAVTDGVTLDQSGSGSTIEIKAAGVSATQLATGAFDQVTILGGAGTAAHVAYAPSVQITAIYGDAPTLAANTTYALRWGMPANGETVGKLYLADWDTTSFDLFWVAGLYNSTSATPTGTPITIINKGSFTLGTADTAFGSSDQGKPVWLGSAGAFGPNSTFAPAAGDANEKLGIAQSASIIWIESQMMGIS